MLSVNNEKHVVMSWSFRATTRVFPICPVQTSNIFVREGVVTVDSASSLRGDALPPAISFLVEVGPLLESVTSSGSFPSITVVEELSPLEPPMIEAVSAPELLPLIKLSPAVLSLPEVVPPTDSSKLFWPFPQTTISVFPPLFGNCVLEYPSARPGYIQKDTCHADIQCLRLHDAVFTKHIICLDNVCLKFVILTDFCHDKNLQENMKLWLG